MTRLGSGDREKNVGQMIGAVAKLKRILPGLKYEIAGEGPLRPDSRQWQAIAVPAMP